MRLPSIQTYNVTYEDNSGNINIVTLAWKTINTCQSEKSNTTTSSSQQSNNTQVQGLPIATQIQANGKTYGYNGINLIKTKTQFS